MSCFGERKNPKGKQLDHEDEYHTITRPRDREAH